MKPSILVRPVPWLSTLLTVLLAALLAACVPPTPKPTAPTATATPAARTFHYLGRVIDGKTFSPIHGAKIALDLQGAPPIVYTDSEGIFRFPLTFAGSSISGRVRIEADGYQNYDRIINLSAAETNMEDFLLAAAAQSPAVSRADNWLVIEGMGFYAARPGAQVRVMANVNGTEYEYPSVGGIKWLEVGPGMSAQKYRLPPTDNHYVIRFEADVRVPGTDGEPDTMGKLTSVAEDIVAVPGDIPFSGQYVLHTLDPVHMARSAGANAVISYRITNAPN